MKTLGYYNGAYGPIEEMSVPMNDRVCWFGDGVYDAGPCRNYHIFAIDEHIDRFFRSAEALDIRMPMEKAGMKQIRIEKGGLEVGDVVFDKMIYEYRTDVGAGLRDE